MLRVALHGLDQIRNQIVAPLQLVLDLRPLRLDRFFLADEPVVRTAGQRQRRERQDDEPSAVLRVICMAILFSSAILIRIVSIASILPTPAAAAAAAAAAAEAAEPAAEAAAAAAEAAAAEAAAERADAARPAAPAAAAPAAHAAAARRRRCG